VVSDSIRKITDLGFKNSGAQMLPRDSVILTSRASVGFVALSGKELCTNQGFQSLIPKPSVLSKFLMFWIQQNRPEFESRSAGSTFKEISKSNVKSIKLQLPPLPEQKRIVDLISSVDLYIKALQQQLESAKRSRNAVLHELLIAGDDEWVETSLGEIADWGSGGTPKADNAEYYGGAIPWCVIGDLTEGEVWETEKKISQLGLTNSSAKIIDPGSVLLAMYGASIGRTGISAIPMATNQAIAFANCKEEMVLPKYLLVYLQTQKSKFIEMGQGAAQPNISQTIIKTWPISLPPIVQQKKVIERIESFSKLIESADLLVSKTKNLRSSLLGDLLSGKHEIPVSYDKAMGAA
jgi:type I restriction enzyme S subunit